tara:strand:- start:4105 stop:5463 length:1359 start_codon:yes stop_codon:yes gene_type:complete
MSAMYDRQSATLAALPTPAPEVRRSVADLLSRSEAFNQLTPEQKTDIAKNTAIIADYLARPEGIEGQKIPGGVGHKEALAATQANAPQAEAMLDMGDNKAADEASWDERKSAVDAIGNDKFEASAAREGAKVAGLLLNEVKFPTFVSSLIEGVFQSITKSSIEQMEAYQDMIASVAKSLKQFMDDNVTENQGRDNMVDQFPDLFEIGFDDFSDEPGPKLQLREGVDENDALKKVNNKLEFEDGQMKSLDLSDANVEKALIENSRIQLARQRQQLMASMVLMGINRIVVTDGRISAKIMYEVRANDRYSRRRSATAMDVARDRYGNVQTTSSGEGTYDTGSNRSGSRSDGDYEYNADYFAKGDYKYENKPVITASTTAAESNDSSLQTKIQLTGAVDVNFKSDYLPLDKMATPGMIAAIQGNSSPVDPNVVPSAKNVAATPAPGGTVAPAPAA